jgi:beta-glucanase (GH16 family)
MRTDRRSVAAWLRFWQHLLLLLLLWSVVMGTLSSTPTTTPMRPRGRLVFADEFDGGSLNTAVWNTAYWWGRGDTNRKELQYYAEDAFEVRDGLLRIVARPQADDAFPYTSGIITSLGTFSQRYGLFEIRARMPKGKGLLPAGWLLLANRLLPYEVDIFEIPGDDGRQVYMTYHWQDAYGVKRQEYGVFDGPDFSDAFHTFSVEWSPSSLIWFVDGVERFRSYQDVPPVPMYILVNLAVGGEWGGDPDAATQFPAVLEVDYVRVYALPEYAGYSDDDMGDTQVDTADGLSATASSVSACSRGGASC